MAFTKEKLIEQARENIKALKMAAVQNAFKDIRPAIELDLHLAEMALASLTAEPVGEVVLGEYDESGCHPDARVLCITADGQADWENFKDGTRLYATPPAPVVPAPSVYHDADCDLFRPRVVKGVFVPRDCDCRAAMLQGAEPVSQHDELPLDYLQGQKDGLEWAARLAEANHPQTADWLYDDPLELAKAIRKGPDIPEAAGNSPVILDGWVACSERMPEKMVSVLATGDWFDYAVTAWDGKEWLDFDDYEPPVTHWMPLPAAPQQEVK